MNKNSKNPTRLDPASAYPSVEPMLQKHAWSIARSYPGISFEEAMSEAYMAYLTACRLFNPDKGTKFSTFVGFVVPRQLQSFLRRRAKDRLCFADPGELYGESDKQQPAMSAQPLDCPSLDVVEELVQELGPDVRLFVSLLLDGPAEMLEAGICTTHGLLGAARRAMRRMGRSRHEVRKLVDGLKDGLQEAWAA